jgi:hypothetical protein
MKPGVIAIIGALAFGAAAQAQTISRIIANTGLSPEDFTIMSEAARGLYDVPSPQVGRQKSWSNPDSKSHGTVVLEAMKGGCAEIRHMAYPKAAEQSVEIRNRLCPTAEGGWQMQP